MSVQSVDPWKLEQNSGWNQFRSNGVTIRSKCIRIANVKPSLVDTRSIRTVSRADDLRTCSPNRKSDCRIQGGGQVCSWGVRVTGVRWWRDDRSRGFRKFHGPQKPKVTRLERKGEDRRRSFGQRGKPFCCTVSPGSVADQALPLRDYAIVCPGNW